VAFSLLVTLREGVEMALIVAILLGYLRSIGQRQHFKEIWYGVAVAAVVCIAIGAGLEIASKTLDGRIVEAFEGFTMIFAVVMLTAMAFWMKRQASGISTELKAHVNAALDKGSVVALVLLAASAVGREGLETTLFLFAGSTTGGSGFQFVLGGILGFGIAAVVGVAIYHGSSRMPLKQFFNISGVAVIVLAAGLLATSVVKLYEAAILTNLGSRPWDTEHILSMTSTFGKFLSAVLGYDSAPALLQIALYWGYLIVVGGIFLFMPSRPKRPAVAPLPPSGATQSPRV
jgi:high-affinity iron transporter